MEPLILKFRERPTNKSLDFSIIEYSEKLNLSVLKMTKEPAIKYLNLGTETFTKADTEGSDTDRNKNLIKLKSLLDTSTGTRTSKEESDLDHNLLNNLKMLLDTTTITESVEGTDKD